MIDKVISGWSNLIISYLKEENAELSESAERKLRICDPCKSRSKSSCKICGCYLPAKVRSSSSCPKNYFK